MATSTVVVASGDSVEVSHEHIYCDLCDKPHPRFLCSSCRKVYFCSAECQRKTWKQHKKWCKETATIFGQTIPAHKAMGTNTEETPVSKNSECGICLDTCVQPIVLKSCHHAFCGACLRSWDQECRRGNREANYTATCPICRSEHATLDMLTFIITKSAAYCRRGQIQTDPEKKKQLLEMAIRENDKIVQGEQPGSGVYLVTMHHQAKIYILLGDGQKAVEIMQELVSKPFNRMQVEEAIWLQMRITHAEALSEIGHVATAIDILFDIIEATTGRSFPSNIQTDAYKLHCRLWYQVGNWDFCCRAGDMAIQGERHLPGVHKYQALGLYEEGNIDDARMIAARGILHETDESMGTMEENIEVFRKLQAAAPPSFRYIPSPPNKKSAKKCGVCGAAGADSSSGVCFDGCSHRFCYDCVKEWWLAHIREGDNKPIRFKGPQASCPVCHEEIAKLPEDQRQAFLCDPVQPIFCG